MDFRLGLLHSQCSGARSGLDKPTEQSNNLPLDIV